MVNQLVASESLTGNLLGINHFGFSNIESVELGMDYCPLYRVAGCPLFRVSNVLKSMEIRSGLSELYRGCQPLRGVCCRRIERSIHALNLCAEKSLGMRPHYAYSVARDMATPCSP